MDPYDFIMECRSMCKKYIFVEVPTMDYRYMDEPMGPFGERHVNYFTLERLNSLMTTAGFKMVDVDYIFGLDVYRPAYNRV